ncbi:MULTISPECIES: rhodanese family protein [unclassified Brevundimonas]|uniref:rhodanese family protein n=1 Tax=unclassified Brevundimonas TaxID=2622653 RepID=UPI0025BDE54E|nr:MULTISPECIES: rhodanese family protein [unclassified Brevundimonas]
MNALNPLQPKDVQTRLSSGQAVLVDVREADEYARVHIAGAVSAPLSSFETADLSAIAGKQVIFTCRSGNRTRTAADRLAARVAGTAHVLDGGVEAWKAEGLQVRVDAKQPLELMRQVQMVAGGLILLGAALGTVIHPGFWGISAFVGAGLFVAGATGFCGMANILILMPWNRAMKKA